MIDANPSRRGLMLIVVVGFASILLAVSWSFFARMRADAQEAQSVVQEAQARIMLFAAMNYIQETARIGWHDPGVADGIMDESSGWVDLRDGEPGPKDRDGNKLWSDTSAFPEPGGRAARFPMYVMERAPFAVKPKRVHNPLEPRSGGIGREADGSAYYDMPNLPIEPVSDTWADFLAGDRTPKPQSQGMAWFRVYREDAADHDGTPGPGYDTVDLTGHHGIFVVTCGSGGTMGFRDWSEAVASGSAPFDRVTFENLRAQERIIWYRVEWSASVLPGTYGNVVNNTGNLRNAWDGFGGMENDAHDNQLSLVRTPPTIARNRPLEGGSLAPNPVGTIEWIMRLEREPANW